MREEIMKKVRRKKLWCWLCMGCLMTAIPLPGFAWGAEGHRLVARIAQRNLSPQARQAVGRLLAPGETLESIANWADGIRNARPETKNWHFVDIPLNASNYDP